MSPYIKNFVKLQELITEWVQKKDEAVIVVDQILDNLQLDKEAIAAETFHSLLSDMEIIMRLQGIAEARRAGIFREIDRRRESFARQLRLAIEEGQAKVSASLTPLAVAAD